MHSRENEPYAQTDPVTHVRTGLHEDAGAFLYPFVGAQEPREQDLLLAARRHAHALIRALDPARGAVLHAADGAVV